MSARTIGQILVEEALPDDIRPDGPINKKQAEALFTRLAKEHPEQYVEVLHNLSNIGRLAATEYGGVMSFGLNDLTTPPKTAAYRAALNAKIDAITQSPRLTSEQKHLQVIALMRKEIPKIQEKLLEESKSRNNSFAVAIEHGFRGNPAQMTQLLFGNMLVADHRDRAIPVPGMHGYGGGITPVEYWADSYGSRKGYSAVQFATAQTGFFGKQLANMAQRMYITGEDCGAKNTGLRVDGSDSDLIGYVLAQPAGGLPAGTVIDERNRGKLKDKKIIVRSVSTCQQPDGVCQKCAGKRNQGYFPNIGAYVGIDNARTTAEPMTQQMGLSAKHVGGMVGVNDTSISGFDEVNQFMQVPHSFQGAAALAPVDGVVSSIVDAPQGGKYLLVNGQQVWSPRGANIRVKPGDKVEAGDVLDDGTPNPAEIAKYKGLGEGRSYFIDKFGEILRRNKVGAHRRSVEVLARSFFDKVRVNRPEGMMGYAMGEIIPYTEVQNNYKPRPDAKDSSPTSAKGRYLEIPVLHYTIGTRITPSVAKNLSEAGYSSVKTHAEQPGFDPAVIRMMDIPAKDPDWKARLSGFNIKKSFLDSARKGSSSPHQNTSYVPSLLDPSLMST